MRPSWFGSAFDYLICARAPFASRREFGSQWAAISCNARPNSGSLFAGCRTLKSLSARRATAERSNHQRSGSSARDKAHVRSGSISTEKGCPRHVRCAPGSDRIADIAGGPVRANNGLMQRSKQHRYSITSSALTKSVGGTVGLSALLRSGWERTDRRLSPSSFFAK